MIAMWCLLLKAKLKAISYKCNLQTHIHTGHHLPGLNKMRACRRVNSFRSMSLDTSHSVSSSCTRRNTLDSWRSSVFSGVATFPVASTIPDLPTLCASAVRMASLNIITSAHVHFSSFTWSGSGRLVKVGTCFDHSIIRMRDSLAAWKTSLVDMVVS